MDKPIFRCECGYVTHFEKALEAHCRFRHHKPLTEEKPTVNEEKKTVIKKTRKPRAKKTVEKE